MSNYKNSLKIGKSETASKSNMEKELKEEGYDSYSWSDRAGAYYPPHSHMHDECICVVEGEMSFYINNKEYKLKTGEKLYLPAGTIHEARNKSDKEVFYLVGEKS